MSYVALYREWRPQRFEDIVGQVHVTQTLQNAITLGRIAHAYLFCGPRGTGKTTAAKVFAKALNCKTGPASEPCNQCENCIRITEGTSMDVMEIDAASNRGIDEIRDLREKVKFSPTEGRYRVYIIDEVHMLTTEAFNALLKTLEEPPQHVIFILATTEPHKIPMTILSRCQRFDFKRIGVADIMDRLTVVCSHLKVQTDEESLALIAKSAEGGLRDALSVLDQCIVFGGQRVSLEEVHAVLGIVNSELLFKMTEYLTANDSTEALFLINDIVNQGKDLRQFCNDMIEHLRNLMLLQVSDKSKELIAVPENVLTLLLEQSKNISRDKIVQTIDVFTSVAKELKWTSQPRLIMEMAVIQACTVSNVESYQALLNRLEKLEKMFASGVPVVQQKANPKSTTPQPTVSSTTAKAVQLIVDKPEVFKKVRSIWPELMEKLKKIKRTAHAFLIEGEPIAMEKNLIILGFPSEYAFHKENIEKPDNREPIEQLLSEMLGAAVKIKCSFKDAITPATDLKNDKDPVVEEAIKIFGEGVIEFND